MEAGLCIIYFTGNFNEEKLKAEFSENFSLIQTSKSFFVSDSFEVSIAQNDEFNDNHQRKFPDGFLYFRCRMELFFTKEVIEQKYINVVNEILIWLWKKHIPAIAACDYDDKLANNGGYKNSTLPWPGDFIN